MSLPFFFDIFRLLLEEYNFSIDQYLDFSQNFSLQLQHEITQRLTACLSLIDNRGGSTNTGRWGERKKWIDKSQKAERISDINSARSLEDTVSISSNKKGKASKNSIPKRPLKFHVPYTILHSSIFLIFPFSTLSLSLSFLVHEINPLESLFRGPSIVALDTANNGRVHRRVVPDF